MPLSVILKEMAVISMVRPKVYTIQLADDESSKFDKTIKNKSTCKTVLKRCQILRDLNLGHGSGLTHAQIAHTYAVRPGDRHFL